MRANGSAYEFRAESDFLWLVGAAIEDAVIVLDPVAGGHLATLYLPVPFRPGAARDRRATRGRPAGHRDGQRGAVGGAADRRRRHRGLDEGCRFARGSCVT
ncbi:aminopeptidase P N-terminal domain-containing protein [Microbacterium sp. KUDC0406]|uniref:aminopeptidase P N-terminal domain-containing protein n=1 Tax=Microbacterium sp. KUDC0406 TaxID=2909588 RepID=UPI003FA56E06